MRFLILKKFQGTGGFHERTDDLGYVLWPSCLIFRKLLLRIKTGSVIFENHWSKVLIYLILIPTGSFFDKREPPNTGLILVTHAPKNPSIKSQSTKNPMNPSIQRALKKSPWGWKGHIFNYLLHTMVSWQVQNFSVKYLWRRVCEDSMLKDKIF